MFAFCAVLPTEQENTQPALQTPLTNGKILIFQLLSQQSFHLSVHLRTYKRKPKSTLTVYEKEPHSDVLDRPVIGMWLFRFLIVCTAVSCHALCKVVIHDVAERGKIIVPSGTVYAVIDGDKAHTTLTQDFHNLTDFQIVTPRRLMSFMSRYSTFPASTCFIISKNPGRSKQVPLMPSSVKWVGLEKSCWAAQSSNSFL